MKTNRIVQLISVVALLALSVLFLSPVGSVSAAAINRGPGGGQGGGQGGSQPVTRPAAQTGAALTPLSTEEAAALQDAILEEYGALNLYNSVIGQLGSVYPFNRIVNAEQQHVNALVRQAQKYGVSVPANSGLSSTPEFNTLAEACQSGVNAEIADAALYDTLKVVTTHSDLIKVFNTLQSASLNSHLPTFQSCD